MQYFLKSAKGERGPFTEDDLRQLIERGKINGSTPVRTDRQTAWIPLSQLPPPLGHDAADVEMDDATDTPAKPFASMLPPQPAVERFVVQESPRRIRKGFRISSLCFALAVLAFGFAPLWVLAVEAGMLNYANSLDGINRTLFKEREIGVRPHWWGLAISMVSSASLVAAGLIVRDFERE